MIHLQSDIDSLESERESLKENLKQSGRKGDTKQIVASNGKATAFNL